MRTSSHHIFGIIIILSLFSACENDPEDIKEFVSKFETNVETAREVEILYSDSAIVRVVIQAPLMLNHLDRRDPYQEYPDGVKVEFFGPDRSITSILTAKYALRYENQGRVIVRDSVVWQSEEQKKLETEELIWDERKKKIYTNKFVVLTSPDEIIYGYGFEADQDLSHTKINAIEGRLKVEDIKKDPE